MAESTIAILKALLHTDNVKHVLNAASPDCLSPDEIDLLQRLTSFFLPPNLVITDTTVNQQSALEIPSTPPSEDGAVSNLGAGPSETLLSDPGRRNSSTLTGRGRKRPAGDPASGLENEPRRKKWAMSRLAVIGNISKEVRDLIARSKDDVSLFMDDQHDQTKFAKLEDIAKEGETEELMLELMSYAQKVEDRPGVDRVRCCFIWLLIYDFVQEVNGRLGRSESGRRVGAEIRQQITDCLPSGFFDNVYEQGPNSKTSEQMIQDYARRGLKINQLCQEFGEGCVFYLAPKLSANFLAREYRQREDSEIHVKVFQEMREAGLATAAADLNEDGRRIRSHLAGLLRTALASNHSTSSE